MHIEGLVVVPGLTGVQVCHVVSGGIVFVHTAAVAGVHDGHAVGAGLEVEVLLAGAGVTVHEETVSCSFGSNISGKPRAALEVASGDDALEVGAADAGEEPVLVRVGALGAAGVRGQPVGDPRAHLGGGAVAQTHAAVGVDKSEGSDGLAGCLCREGR